MSNRIQTSGRLATSHVPDESTTEMCRRQASEFVQTNPAVSIGAALGLGLGVGTVIGFLLSHESVPPESSYAIGRISRRVMDQVATHVPDAVRQYMGR